MLAVAGIAVVPKAAAQEKSPAAVIRSTREFLRAQRFEGALKQLKELKDPGDRAAEAARLEATAWLGKALQADLAASESMYALHMAGTVKHQMMSLAEQPQNKDFALEVAGEVSNYLKSITAQATAWPAQYRTVLQSLELARAGARRAYELEKVASPGRDEAAALWVWSELCDYLAVREVQIAVLRAATAEVFAPEVIGPIQQVLPADRQGPSVEKRFKETFVRLAADATQGGPSLLALALADSSVLYAAGQQRYYADSFRSAKSRFTSAFLNRLPPPAALPVPDKPAEILAGRSVEERLSAQPESLILPLYQLAARDEKASWSLAASYGLYFALLAHNEAEAGRVLESMLARHPRTPAVLLEQARYSRVQPQGTPAAQGAFRAAFQAGPLQRPVFVSLPKDLQPLWLTSRAATAMSPQFFWPLTSLGNVPMLVPDDPPGERAELPSQRLRMAELLMKGNLRADVVDGIWMAEAALVQFQKPQVPEETRARAKVYQEQLKATTAGMPASLVRPHRLFSTYEVLANGERRPKRTLTVSPTGFAGFGSFPPGI